MGGDCDGEGIDQPGDVRVHGNRAPCALARSVIPNLLSAWVTGLLKGKRTPQRWRASFLMDVWPANILFVNDRPTRS